MIREVHHLHPLPLLSGIPGKQPREKQLLIVAVGGEQQQIRSSLRDLLPALNPIGKLPRGKQPQLIQRRLSGGKAYRQRLWDMSKKRLQIHIVMEHTLRGQNRLRAGFLLRQCQALVLPVKDKIQSGDSLLPG